MYCDKTKENEVDRANVVAKARGVTQTVVDKEASPSPVTSNVAPKSKRKKKPSSGFGKFHGKDSPSRKEGEKEGKESTYGRPPKATIKLEAVKKEKDVSKKEESNGVKTSSTMPPSTATSNNNKSRNRTRSTAEQGRILEQMTDKSPPPGDIKPSVDAKPSAVDARPSVQSSSFVHGRPKHASIPRTSRTSVSCTSHVNAMDGSAVAPQYSHSSVVSSSSVEEIPLPPPINKRSTIHVSYLRSVTMPPPPPPPPSSRQPEMYDGRIPWPPNTFPSVSPPPPITSGFSCNTPRQPQPPRMSNGGFSCPTSASFNYGEEHMMTSHDSGAPDVLFDGEEGDMELSHHSHQYLFPHGQEEWCDDDDFHTALRRSASQTSSVEASPRSPPVVEVSNPSFVSTPSFGSGFGADLDAEKPAAVIVKNVRTTPKQAFSTGYTKGGWSGMTSSSPNTSPTYVPFDTYSVEECKKYPAEGRIKRSLDELLRDENEEQRQIRFVDSHAHTEFCAGKVGQKSYAAYINHVRGPHKYESALLRQCAGVVIDWCQPKHLIALHTTPLGNRDVGFGIKSLVGSHESMFKAGLSTHYGIGVHPNWASEWTMDLRDMMQKTVMDRRGIFADKLVCVGECGLDFHNTSKEMAMTTQPTAFTAQLSIGKEAQLPAQLHIRSGKNDMAYSADAVAIALMQKNNTITERYHRHCFDGTPDTLRAWLREVPNSYVGFTNMLWMNTERYTRLIQSCPIDKILIETDAPFFPLKIYRPGSQGAQPSHPGHARLVAQFIADAKQMPLADVAERLTKNTRDLYDISLPTLRCSEVEEDERRQSGDVL